MAEQKKKGPPAGKRLFFLTAEGYEALRGGANQVLPDLDQFDIVQKKGKTFFRLRPQNPSTTRGGGGVPAAWMPLLGGTEENPTVTVTPGNLVNLVTGAEGGVDMEELDISDGDIVYLSATITDGVVGTIELKAGERWEGHPKPWKFEGDDPPKQTQAYWQLCECNEVDHQLVLARIESGNRTLGLDVIEGKLGLVFK